MDHRPSESEQEAILEKRLELLPPPAPGLAFVVFDIPIEAIGKPRMTGSDAWKKRPPVMRYRDWKDRFNAQVRHQLDSVPLDAVMDVSWVAVFPVPKSYSKTRTTLAQGARHRAKPDRDNIDKAILDTIFKEDSQISDGFMCKRYCLPNESPRLILRLSYLPS